MVLFSFCLFCSHLISFCLHKKAILFFYSLFIFNFSQEVLLFHQLWSWNDIDYGSNCAKLCVYTHILTCEAIFTDNPCMAWQARLSHLPDVHQLYGESFFLHRTTSRQILISLTAIAWASDLTSKWSVYIAINGYSVHKC